jgi:hypothetical protein
MNVSLASVVVQIGSLTPHKYGAGSGEVIPTTYGGSKFDNSTSVLLTFPPPVGGITGMSNPHMALEYGREVFVPDLVRFLHDHEREISSQYSSACWQLGWVKNLAHRQDQRTWKL